MLSKIIGEFQESRNLEDLKRHMQALSEQYGFSSYNFIDAGNLVDEVPYYMTTVETSWEETYRDNNFVDIDPYISLARRSNTPFTWGALPTDRLRSRGPKRATSRLMEAASDFRFNDGFLVPFHFRDDVGRYGAALMVYLWKDAARHLEVMLSEKRFELHVITIYWAQRVIDLVSNELRSKESPFRRESISRSSLTDRERAVLRWAAAGKTNTETADILHVSENTVETYMKAVLSKLGASNKTHAVALAIRNGVIDL